ncbi:MAG: DJ-1/PfpI family protein [Candidatus Thorarchaeota archaeon]|nr:DJ-1/PfpI family protein [Candidatus Thorarchaeota archaeon]
METFVLLYDNFVDFEITLALLLLRNKSQIRTFTVDDEIVPNYSTLNVRADMKLSEVDPESIDLLIIPGGSPGPYADRSEIQKLLNRLNERGIPIAAICGGPEFLAQAGILKGKRMTHGHDPEYAGKVFMDCLIQDEDVVIDGNIITARGQAYSEFAVAVYKHLGLFDNKEEEREMMNFFKNIH